MKYEGEVGKLEFDIKEALMIPKFFGMKFYSGGPPEFSIFNGGINN